MSNLAMSTLIATAQRIRTRELSPVEATRHLLGRIETLEPQLHSFVTVLAEQAMAQAAVAEREILQGRYRGPLHGIPIAVKDLCFTKNIRTTCGSQLLEHWLPDKDATVVQKLANAGAILLGKLHMTEFAFRWHHPYRPAPLNPWDKSRWPGVSSSGSGVATAAGLCFGALGTDTGGSIRFPAAACGIVGLKPTYGRVSRYGVFPLAESLDNVGPLTRSVADAAVMLQAIAGPDPLDPTSSRAAIPDYLAALEQGVEGVRIGVDEQFITARAHPEVSAAVLAAVRLLEDLGAQLVEVAMPDVDEIIQAWLSICFAEAAVAHATLFPARAGEYGPFREVLENGAKLRGQDYAQAHILREAFAGRLNALFEQVDVLACPTMPTVAPVLDGAGNPIMAEQYVRARFTYPFNFSRNPTLSLPCGFDAEGMPLSLQLVGRHFEEAMLCRIGNAYEQATTWHEREPETLKQQS
jgi:amidase